MKGLPYKGTFAAKGSELHTALSEGREADAKRIYAHTTARAHAVLYGLAVPQVVYQLDKEGKPNGKWHIESADSLYDSNGRFTTTK